jgi:predicted membrane-bound spermidine synthase
MLRGLLRLVVFWSGMVTLGVELAASRLLAPFFGTSTLIWAVLIGMILIYLSIGNWLGGRWADRTPTLGTLIRIASMGAVFIGAIPMIAAPVLTLSVQGFAEYNGGLLGGSLIGVLILFTLPMILLGCVSPFAIRLTMEDVQSSGRLSGQLYALSTLGSFVGTFIPVLWLIPAYGTRWTFWLLALSLLVVLFVVALLTEKRYLVAPALGFLLVLTIAITTTNQPIKTGDAEVLWEGESLYHYIRVVQRGEWHMLELNEGQGTHSAYYPGSGLTGGVWDFYLLAPFFNPAPYNPETTPKSWAIIGVAAGSTPRAIQTVYGNEPIIGVEIDGKIVEVGQEYFNMGELAHLEVVIDDGRTWLAQDTGQYDVIGIDAYRQPYIPFHLATVEFFQQARDHLTPNGVVAINVGRGPNDWRLVDALTSTMQEVFPSVFAIDMDESENTILIGTNQTVTAEDVRANVAAATHPALTLMIDRARGRTRIPEGNGLVFTDDRAPVEQVIDGMILRFVAVEAGN